MAGLCGSPGRFLCLAVVVTPLLKCPYFLAWVANTVAELSDMLEHSRDVAGLQGLTFTETRTERLSSPPENFAKQALTLDARLALADLCADFRTLH